jgi:peptide subunit release factor 1 (eRF1)
MSMSFFDKVKQTASDAADTVKDNVQQAKLKNDIVEAYEDLGRKVYELVDQGKMGATGISRYVKHIKDLRAQLDAVDQPDYAKDAKKS